MSVDWSHGAPRKLWIKDEVATFQDNRQIGECKGRIARHVGVEDGLLGFVLLGESPLILCVAITSLKHELADAGVRVQGQRCMAEVYDLQDLMVRDARMHEPRSNMDGKAESGEPASAFEPAGDVIGQRDLFPRDPEYHFAWLDDNTIAIL